MATTAIPHDQRQPIEIIPPAAPADPTTAVLALLDATLSLSDNGIFPSFALLPDAEHFAAVDLAVRLWASTKANARLDEWGQWSTEPTPQTPGYWIEGVKVEIEFRSILTLHTPQSLRKREPVVAFDNVIPLPVAPPETPVTEPAQPVDLDDSARRFSLLEID